MAPDILKQFDKLRMLWSFRVHWTLNPRSTPMELFLNTVCQLYAEDHNYIEYGPFLGHSAFFNTALAEHGYLVDTFMQGDFYKLFDKEKAVNSAVVTDALTRILHLNMSLIGGDNYTLIKQNIVDQPILDYDAGVIFWDVFVANRDKEANALITMVKDRILKKKKVIIIIDDVVHERTGDNPVFAAKWKSAYAKELKKHFTPFLVTTNRLYLSNFEIDPSFNKLLQVLVDNNYLEVQEASNNSRFYDSNVYQRKEDMSSMKFILDDVLWQSMSQAIVGK